MLSHHGPCAITSRRRLAELPAGVRQVDLATACRADVVFLTVSISAMDDVTRQIAPLLRADALVADTCSVKVVPAQTMIANLPSHVHLVATHPMFGPDSARERTDPLPVVTWPLRVDATRYESFCDRLVAGGMRIIERSPDDHDREAARTQGVTHLVGRILNELGLEPSDLATLGYTRLLQVMEQTCRDPIELFRDLQTFNPYTAQMRSDFRSAIARALALLEPGIDDLGAQK